MEQKLRPSGAAQPSGRRVRLETSPVQRAQSALPDTLPYEDRTANAFLEGLSRFNKALVCLLEPQAVAPLEGPATPVPPPYIPLGDHPGPDDEIRDETGSIEIPTISPGERTVLWRYQLPKTDPRYRPLNGKYELGIHFAE